MSAPHLQELPRTMLAHWYAPQKLAAHA